MESKTLELGTTKCLLRRVATGIRLRTLASHLAIERSKLGVGWMSP
ncbi:hypothetical protein K0504_03960 [Neiella marina]|uniref:Uncharacterized protein n=1 Tax=Neiella holothuriorum TaxID=2870530 RepID=A0ABS7ECW6_9GAMM|nr:hypothetical protein [Neiella holothuriorum]MBW8190182.1 hypothetical protein [Neiella holothuriorum]